jgi:hypothetical protein
MNGLIMAFHNTKIKQQVSQKIFITAAYPGPYTYWPDCDKIEYLIERILSLRKVRSPRPENGIFDKRKRGSLEVRKAV